MPAASIETWEQLAQAFLSKNFPLAKTARVIKELTSFSQNDNETLYEAWEHFKELQRLCPHHQLPVGLLMQTFYNGLNPITRGSLDAMSGGLFMKKTSAQARELLEEMAINSSMWPAERGHIPSAKPSSSTTSSVKGIVNLDPVAMLQAQFSALSHKIDRFMALCDPNGQPIQTDVDYEGMSEIEQVNFVQGQNQTNNPYSNTYNPGWRNHPNFNWRDNNNVNANQNRTTNYQNQSRDSISTLSSKIDKFIDAMSGKISNHDDGFIRIENKFDQLIKNQSSSIHNLEIQIGQLAKSIPSRKEGSLPSHTEENPKEHVKAITLRSGKNYLGPEMPENSTLPGTDLPKPKEDILKKKDAPIDSSTKTFVPKPPFPHKVRNKDYDKQLLTFLDKLKNLHINLTFMDAITQIPNYGKFLKDLISKKISWEGISSISLTEDCSSIVSSNLPTKLKDPGCFTIPCKLGDIEFPSCLCDLGASINLMPLSIFNKLGLEEDIKRTNMVLQLADQTTKRPYGIIEDILVKVDKFIFPTDFVILDFAYDVNCPLIFGRPFMNTGRALVDVSEGKVVLRIGDDKIEFDMNQVMKYPMEDFACMKLDLIEECVNDIVKKEEIIEPIMSEELEDKDPERLIREDGPVPPSIVVPPKLELKELPSHLRYAFLGEGDSLPIIISNKLTQVQEEKLKEVVRNRIGSMGWQISDLKGINPSIVMHRIHLEEDKPPKADRQRRLNPNMKEVVKNEITKLLDNGIIYPISDSEWVSPIHCVAKKGGITVVRNEEGELIPTRTTTGWRVCIDYRNLNKATRKDHFLLPFIDQMIERIVGHAFYYFLDGYSGFFQIYIYPDDQDKTTFTCPYGTFAYRRMPFGLCNAPATFQRCMTAIFNDFIKDIMEVFMDDFSVYGDSFDSCLENLDKVLSRCEETNLVLNWEKCHFMVDEGIVLGHKISEK
ncbi:uncharacterized protein [Euphorbia lathyris]|uniref:uncharacterized protein n=1 Tax=Euphorbia lathyris TaxID=212925 RepID=UPI00331419C0